MGAFQILEHTADVGLLATGSTLEETFEQATFALAEIAGIRGTGSGEKVAIEVRGRDLAANLVDWLSEVIYIHDAREQAIATVEVREVGERSARGEIELVPLGRADERGTQVKAVTYHRLRVGKTPDGWEAEVYLDI